MASVAFFTQIRRCFSLWQTLPFLISAAVAFNPITGDVLCFEEIQTEPRTNTSGCPVNQTRHPVWLNRSHEENLLNSFAGI